MPGLGTPSVGRHFFAKPRHCFAHIHGAHARQLTCKMKMWKIQKASPWKVWMHRPDLTSHSLVVWSNEPVMSLSPCWLKDKLTISAVCPNNDAISVPVSVSHNLAVLSMDPVAMTFPCGLKLRHTISVACPRSVWYNSPVSEFHTLHVLSKEPVMILSPKGLLKAMAYTTFLCPAHVVCQLLSPADTQHGGDLLMRVKTKNLFFGEEWEQTF